ncbi:glycosyltransferase family 2 protein [Quatrionicoccus australiensis]|uniref:glycosyltransferase family 2 protein n=1 Tax=Quatrionicoccus australiensis TaxID=138118 RepID=UPI001CFA2242|nr:glycosyltransferase family 2 protein [Quatrionicoccus australiensis]MCB4358832.1 glycosyltransferase family 2 protein [Quatrionicoccus australiensis]
MPALEQAFTRASPRLSPREISLLSHGIRLGVLIFAVLAVSTAFFLHDLMRWSSGITLLAYDAALLLFVLWKTLPLWRAATPAEPPVAARPSLGVIIAAHNEVAVIERTLQSLLTQTVVPDEILIADDGSTDGTAALLIRRFSFVAPAPGGDSAWISQSTPGLRWLRLPHGGKARALNNALPLLRSELVVTVDADTRLANDALDEMQQAFGRNRSLVAATGVLTPCCDDSPGGRLLQWFQTCEYIRNFMSRYAWMRANSLLLISGAFAGFRREALLTVGGFDAQCLVEDYEVIHRLHRHAIEHGHDWQVSVVGSACARTSAPSSLRDFLRQRQRWFAGFLQTQHWNRDMIGNRRFGKLGTLMLPVKSVDTIQPFFGLTAALTLLGLVLHSELSLLGLLLGIISGKIVIDIVCQVWIIHLYRRLTGGRAQISLPLAILAILLEPFSFQLLRQFAAVLGWYRFLSGRQHWGRQARHALA